MRFNRIESFALCLGLALLLLTGSAMAGTVTAADVTQIAAKYKDGDDAGQAAYSTPHLTTNPPAPLAFAAIGQRDLQPYSLRVRLLGLHSQLYESEPVNPELVMPGRFDFAFVLVYLAPLFVIALMHDIVAGEREAGRLRLLVSLPVSARGMWLRRIGLRFLLVWTALLLPLAAGIAIAGAGAGPIALVAALYLLFWFGIGGWVAARARTSAGSAAILLACLVGLTMVLPTVVNAAISRMVPVSKGVELALAQRQEVHQGWDLPKPVTFEKFFRTHPEWKDTPPVTGRFHWKWYYAMHQAGDDAVAGRVEQYRRSMLAREDWTRRAGLLLASVNVQVLLHRIAATDLQAQLDYQDGVAAFHARLRRFFYPYFFEERPFGAEDFGKLPVYQAQPLHAQAPLGSLLALALLAFTTALWGMARLARAR